ncbi:MAG: hypothetical protein DMG38_02325 [Acidobacteria bacterium]|nr:MAG: hypothetical protein DMG38_02325 [Acidobacteriota bacterium]
MAVFLISPFPSAIWPNAVPGAPPGGTGQLDQLAALFRKQNLCGTQPQLGAIRSLNTRYRSFE